MDLDALKRVLNETRINAVVTIANANNPVDSIASDADKAALVRLLQARNIPLIEDDICGDVCYDELRPRPARAFDISGNVLLCGGFRRVYAPACALAGLRPENIAKSSRPEVHHQHGDGGIAAERSRLWIGTASCVKVVF
jgi:DNA-binding transcriptional MocR family regulator